MHSYILFHKFFLNFRVSFIFIIIMSYLTFCEAFAQNNVENITGIVTRVEVLTRNYIDEMPEQRQVCQIEQVPILAKKNTQPLTDKEVLGAIIGGVLGSKMGEGDGKTAATALGALIGSNLVSGKQVNKGGALLGGIAGSQIGKGSGKNAAAAAGALVGSQMGNSNTREIIGYEDREVCSLQNVVVKKSVQKVTGYLLNVSIDNKELIFETKRSAQPGDVINIRKTVIYEIR